MYISANDFNITYYSNHVIEMHGIYAELRCVRVCVCVCARIYVSIVQTVVGGGRGRQPNINIQVKDKLKTKLQYLAFLGVLFGEKAYI